eukprot:130644-Heterocapsa_arctica.AAC.1
MTEKRGDQRQHVARGDDKSLQVRSPRRERHIGSPEQRRVQHRDQGVHAREAVDVEVHDVGQGKALRRRVEDASQRPELEGDQ